MNSTCYILTNIAKIWPCYSPNILDAKILMPLTWKKYFSTSSYNVSANIWKSQRPSPCSGPHRSIPWTRFTEKIWRPPLGHWQAVPDTHVESHTAHRSIPFTGFYWVPAACGPLFKKGQTRLSLVLHLPQIALPINRSSRHSSPIRGMVSYHP